MSSASDRRRKDRLERERLEIEGAWRQPEAPTDPPHTKWGLDDIDKLTAGMNLPEAPSTITADSNPEPQDPLAGMIFLPSEEPCKGKAKRTGASCGQHLLNEHGYCRFHISQDSKLQLLLGDATIQEPAAVEPESNKWFAVPLGAFSHSAPEQIAPEAQVEEVVEVVSPAPTLVVVPEPRPSREDIAKMTDTEARSFIRSILDRRILVPAVEVKTRGGYLMSPQDWPELAIVSEGEGNATTIMYNSILPDDDPIIGRLVDVREIVGRGQDPPMVSPKVLSDFKAALRRIEGWDEGKHEKPLHGISFGLISGTREFSGFRWGLPGSRSQSSRPKSSKKVPTTASGAVNQAALDHHVATVWSERPPSDAEDEFREAERHIAVVTPTVIETPVTLPPEEPSVEAPVTDSSDDAAWLAEHRRKVQEFRQTTRV